MTEREIIHLVNETADRVKDSYSAVVAEQLKAVHLELKRLNDSFVKQNGRVNQLEHSNLIRHLNCPNQAKIDNIVSHSVGLKAVRKAAWGAAGGMALIVGIVASLIAIFKDLW